MRLLFLLSLSLFFTPLLASCGHTPVASPVFVSPSIAILVLKNTTQEPILEATVTSAFKERFLRKGIPVLSEKDAAAFVLTGTINRFEQAFQSLNEKGQATEYRVTIGLSYTLHKKEKGKTTSAGEPSLKAEATASADYFVRADPAEDQTAQDRAVREASFRLADNVADTFSDFISKEAPP